MKWPFSREKLNIMYFAHMWPITHLALYWDRWVTLTLWQKDMKEGKIEGSEASLTLHLLNPSLLGKAKPTFWQMDGKAGVDSVVTLKFLVRTDHLCPISFVTVPDELVLSDSWKCHRWWVESWGQLILVGHAMALKHSSRMRCGQQASLKCRFGARVNKCHAT